MIKILNRLSNGVATLKSSKLTGISTKNRFCSNNTSKSLNEILRQRIKATGPMSLAHFMKEVLTNPVCGYYTTRDVFGRQGDFTTSPEISQLFGELIAVWFINEWAKAGQPKPFNFVELGPGRGTLVEGIYKVFRQFKLNSLMSIHLVEVSEVLCNIQAEKLGVAPIPNEENAPYYKHGKTKDDIDVFWYKSVYDYKYNRFSLIVAHEFFDALPIHKFKKTSKGWCEVLIDIDHDDSSEKRFKYVLSPGPTTMSKVFIRPEETRDEVEINSESVLIMGHLAQKMESLGGIALAVDYGHCGTKTDTFRAFRSHEQCDPLVDVGTADLTADVNFDSLTKAVAPKLITLGPVTQRQFLKQMQIDVRLQDLMNKCKDEKVKKNLKLGYHMLVDEDKMGCRFHFMAFFPAIMRKVFKKFPVIGFLKDDEINKITDGAERTTE